MSHQIKNVNNEVEIVKRNQKKFEPEKDSNWSYKLTSGFNSSCEQTGKLKDRSII